MCVGLIVPGVSVVPGGLAVLSLGEYGLRSGGHFGLLSLRLAGSAGGVSLTQKGVKVEEAVVYIELTTADTAIV